MGATASHYRSFRIRVFISMLLTLFFAACQSPADDDQSPSHYFERIATFPIFLNGANADPKAETVAEILDATEDGNTLIYTDGAAKKIGFVDITDPENPMALPEATLAVGGEPTSVAVAGPYALVAVNTSPDFLNPSGSLVVVDIGLKTIVRTIPMGGQPDSVAVSPDKKFAAIAIENERDEDRTEGVPEEGGLPQLPAGNLQVIKLSGPPANWTPQTVDLTNLKEAVDVGATDPEPEFVDINENNIAAVTLQENNHIVLVDLEEIKVIRDFSAGKVDLKNIDTVKNKIIEPNGNKLNVPREPDAIGWLQNLWMVTANEGDFLGGSRGFSIFSQRGEVTFDSGSSFEYLALRHGHYPEKRAGKKGVEPEGVEVGKYNGNPYIFVASERGNFIAVYKHQSGSSPEFIQLLPAGVAPEGIKAIPRRNLLVAGSEKGDQEDKFRATLTIYRLQKGKPSYPTIVSADSNSLPIAWGALSALAADRYDKNLLYTVHDGFYQNSRIYKVNVKNKPAVIFDEIILKLNGSPVNRNLEGLVQRKDGSFWTVSEGNAATTTNLLMKVAADGTVLEEIPLPASVKAQAVRFGFEGVAVVGQGDDERVYVAFQREWKDDPASLVRIGEYNPSNGEWRFFRYPLDAPTSPNGGWVGLSEIVAVDDTTFWVIERDNQGNTDARIKRIYRFSIDGVEPQPQGSAFPVLTKNLVRDLLPDLQAPNGPVLEKLEGLTISKSGNVYIVTDNDGVNDASGETQFIRLGKKDDLK